MSKELWDDLKCDGYPCTGECDTCQVKDDRRCFECGHFEETGLICTGSYGRCTKDDYHEAVCGVWKACDDFEEAEDV